MLNDFAKAPVRLASSIRRFSFSISRAQDEHGTSRPSRAQRSAAAINEGSSLAAQSSRGIDARGLAARVAGEFTIRRVDHQGQAFDGQVVIAAPSRRRRRVDGDRRGQGGPARGQGGGRDGADGKRRRRAPQNEEDGTMEKPLTEDEKFFAESLRLGMPEDYIPRTTLDSLGRERPSMATITAPKALEQSVYYRMQVATDTVYPPLLDGHLDRIQRGHGTVFWDTEDRNKNQIAMMRLRSRDKIHSPSEAYQNAILETIVAGKYEAPSPPEKGDVMRMVQTYLTRNESYLSTDSRKLQEKLTALLPAHKPMRTTAKKTA